MTNDSPNPEAEPTNLPFHRAGSYAVGALIATMVLQFIYMKVFFLRLSPHASRLAGYVPLLVMLSAIPAGFIALCGIPRFGRKKLLWKGLVGLLVPLALVWTSMQVTAMLIESVRQHPEILMKSDQ